MLSELGFHKFAAKSCPKCGKPNLKCVCPGVKQAGKCGTKKKKARGKK